MAHSTKSLLQLSSLPIIASFISTSSAHPTNKPNPTQFPPQNSTAASIEWGACPPETGLPSTLQCATYSVPVNWDEPYGEHFDLGLAKLPAAPSNTTSKIGSLFVNPGGPGGSSTSLVASIAGGALHDETLLSSFDFIGLDPRGVGLSNQVKCDMGIYAERVSLWPKNQEQFDALVDRNRRLGESCRNLTGPLIEHIDTISVVKDHEAVRIALGNEPFNYLGLSYGAQLGSQYADLFPDNIRTLALDGVTQHSQSESTNLLVEGTSYAVALTHFFEWAAKDDSSPLKGKNVEEFWKSLLANATETPIPAPGCNGTDCAVDVSVEEILIKSQLSLVFASGDISLGASWGLLASALYNASQGDATTLSPSFTDESALSMLSIICLDWTHTSTLAVALQKQVMAETYMPLVHGASETWAFQHRCAGWPFPVKNPPKKLNVKTKTTVLLVNSASDPETGYPWALGVREEIENNVLVTRKGDGHTSISLGGETAGVIGQYLITGKAPEDGLILDS